MICYKGIFFIGVDLISDRSASEISSASAQPTNL